MNGRRRKERMKRLTAALTAVCALALIAPANATTPGFNENWTRTAVDPAAGTAMGAQVARINFQWCSAESTQGTWNNSFFNTRIGQIQDLVDDGYKVLVTFITAPQWARETALQTGGASCSNVSGAAASPPAPDGYWAEWRAFIAEVVSRLETASLDDNIEGYMSWNEPNTQLFWPTDDGLTRAADADHFATLVRKTWNELGAGTTRVYAGGILNRTNSNDFPTASGVAEDIYLTRLYTVWPVTPEYDRLSLHPYGPGLVTGLSDASGAYENFKDARDTEGDSTPISITEVGSDSYSDGEAAQATKLGNIWEYFSETVNGVHLVVFHRLVDDPAEGLLNMGVFEDDGTTTKDSYCVLKTAWTGSC